MNSLEGKKPTDSLVIQKTKHPGLTRSLPLIDDNRIKVLSDNSFHSEFYALVRQNEGGKQ
jgi:hypothetical protein